MSACYITPHLWLLLCRVNALFYLCNVWLVNCAVNALCGALVYGHPAPTHSKSKNVLAGDLNLIKVPSDMSDNQVLFLSDILATGWHATELGNVHDGDSVAIWGCGPGQCLLLKCLYLCPSFISLSSQISQSHTRSTVIGWHVRKQ